VSNGFIVTKEDWENMTPDQQSWMTFNAVQAMNDRVSCLEKHKWVNSTLAFAGGIIGGIIFFVVKAIGGFK
jgi:hypothetical protein